MKINVLAWLVGIWSKKTKSRHESNKDKSNSFSSPHLSLSLSLYKSEPSLKSKLLLLFLLRLRLRLFSFQWVEGRCWSFEFFSYIFFLPSNFALFPSMPSTSAFRAPTQRCRYPWRRSVVGNVNQSSAQCLHFWDMGSTVGYYTAGVRERNHVMGLTLVAWPTMLVFSLKIMTTLAKNATKPS